MIVRRRPNGVTVAWTPAKINLFLEILGKRADGYHELETLLVAVDLYDTLVFQEEPTGQILFRCDETALPRGTANLVVRAARLAREAGGCPNRGVSIWLRKRIPVAAGLGGGSSDAAATLAVLNQLWRIGLSVRQLSELGARIGSDVPFFFHAPMAVGGGRGERIKPLALPRPLHLVLVCPEQGLSTAAVFAHTPTPRQPLNVQPLLHALTDPDGASLGPLLFNRLAATALRLCPALERLQEAWPRAALTGPTVTGSGSAVFGLAPDRTTAVHAAHYLRCRVPGRVIVVRTLTAQAARNRG